VAVDVLAFAPVVVEAASAAQSSGTCEDLQSPRWSRVVGLVI
jgi:hypothetical protein